MAVEFLADAAVPERHPLIKKAKDLAPGGVLIAALNGIRTSTSTLPSI